ncbi:unnamed protein product [Closterium sp. NIES-53]
MLALCREHRLEHRTKHIALRYFLACELQQCGQLRLGYVASQANTADIFTKALQPCDHQRFCTMLGLLALFCLALLDWSCDPSFSPTLPMGRGTHDGCVDVCTTFAEMIVSNIHGRLGDLESLLGSRLFTPDACLLDRGERHARFVEWLESLITLFKAEMNDDILPSINKRRAVKELRVFTSVLASAHKTERIFHAGLTAMLKTPVL